MTDVSGQQRSFHNPRFTSPTHTRLLLRVDRTLAIQRAIQLAVAPGVSVLDAGCGTGLLSFLAVGAGASEVVAVDRENVELARALAVENGLGQNIRFLEADLSTLELPGRSKRFDVLIAFVYTNHLVVDEARSELVYNLRERFGSTTCQTIPNKIRYSAVACDWPQADAFTELHDLRRSISDLENRYHLKFQSLFEAARTEIQTGVARPRSYADYEWSPAWGSGGYRYQRGAFRVLSKQADVAGISYDTGTRFKRYPHDVTFEIESSGTFSAVMWTQELWFNDSLIWTAEHMSPLSCPVHATPGSRLRVRLDDAWRQTNVLSPAETP